VRAAAAQSARLLADLSARGLRLGVVSNGCGNVDVLCEDLGYAPFLSLIVDSRQVGLCKPDPAIFTYAAAKLGARAPNVLMVGDSFERDIRPAKSVGMMTAWLEGPARRECPDPSLVDLRLRALAELPGALQMTSRTVA
jgi:putative hydrolase of the HAD superfamily